MLTKCPVAVRAYAVGKEASARPSRSDTKPIGPSDLALVLDAETTFDAVQRLKFGSYQVRENKNLVQSGIFYEPASLTKTDIKVIKRFAEDAELRPPYLPVLALSRAQFVAKIFFPIVYDLDALCVGTNLPFVLSRLAIDHKRAVGKLMHGGFSFVLSEDKTKPRLQIRHLTKRAAFIQFANPERMKRTPQDHELDHKSAHSRGYFLDVLTLESALFPDSESSFEKTYRHNYKNPAKPVTRKQLKGAMKSLDSIWNETDKLRKRYESFSLTRTLVTRIYSAAGIGKAHFREMEIKPWTDLQPKFPRELLGAIMSSFFAGRAEVHIRRNIARVLYCDFLSMYPTVCTLMGLWHFVIAKRMAWKDVTDETTSLLQEIRLGELQNQEIWKELSVLVQVQPMGDRFPVRAKYNQPYYSVGFNKLKSASPLWYTLADCIASTLLSRRPPKVIRALRFSPVGKQHGLKPIRLMGDSAYPVDPREDDFFRKLIDLRNQTKRAAARSSGEERVRLEAEELAFKTVANSSTYGIFVQMNTQDYERGQEVKCYGHNNNSFASTVKSIEDPGEYFHPLLATLITGGARLMLAMTEALTKEAGITWAFCDTDSMALAPLEGMERAEFMTRALRVQQSFKSLNPYTVKEEESLLEIEDENYEFEDGGRTDQLTELYCCAISAKRYALFSRDQSGQPIVRKASAHGLGHLLISNEISTKGIPPPSFPLEKIGVTQWQYELWYEILLAALGPTPNRVNFELLKYLNKPAASQFVVINRRILRWFRSYNCDKSYSQQVKPFNYLYSLQVKPKPTFDLTEESEALISPIAPYGDLSKAHLSCFDRDTGVPVPPQLLQTYREVLRAYHLHPERKSERGDYTNRGYTGPKHVSAVAVEYIGKEANRLEEQWHLGLDDEAQIVYGLEGGNLVLKELQDACSRFGLNTIAQRLRIPQSRLRRILKVSVPVSLNLLVKLLAVEREFAEEKREYEKKVSELRAVCHELGIARVARQAGIDSANLSKMLNGRRKMNEEAFLRVEAAVKDLQQQISRACAGQLD